MPDETTFELQSVHFGAEPVAVFRFGYERFELRARLGPGNLEHAIAAAARWRPASLRDGRTRRWSSRSGFALARTEGQCITRPRATNDCSRREVVIQHPRETCRSAPVHNKTSPIEWPAASTARQTA